MGCHQSISLLTNTCHFSHLQRFLSKNYFLWFAHNDNDFTAFLFSAWHSWVDWNEYPIGDSLQYVYTVYYIYIYVFVGSQQIPDINEEDFEDI